MPPAVILGGAALIGAGAQIIAGNKAAKAQQDAANSQIAESRRQYDQDRADLAPWRTIGGAAEQRIGSIYGLDGSKPNNTGTGADAYGGFFASPDYQFRLAEGNKAIERSAAARGQLASGATLKAANNYAQNTASSEYGNWYARLAAIANGGQSATDTGIAAGQASTNSINAATQAAGNARASSYANVGSAINSGLQNAVSGYLYTKGYGGGGAAKTPNPYGTPPIWGG